MGNVLVEITGKSHVFMALPSRVFMAIDKSDGSFYALKWVLDHLFGSISVVSETNRPEEVGTVVMVHV